jgi:alpha-amylase
MAESLNGVMFQYFHWYLPPDGQALWEQLRDEADNLRAIGVDAVWIPPPQKCDSGGFSVGYDVFDYFDLGAYDQRGTVATKYGTKEQLHEAINALHGFVADGPGLTPIPGTRYIQVYVDIVLNQMFGGEVDPDWWQAIRVNPDNRTEELWGTGYERGEIEIRGYTWFRYPARHGEESQFEWRARHFDSVDRADSILQNGSTFKDYPENKYIYRFLHNELGHQPPDKQFETWVSLEKGNYDYLFGADLDFGRPDVREHLKYWGAWLMKTIGADGVRLDAVKHYTANYAREWMGHVRAQVGRPLFAVGEYIAGDTGPLHAYLTQVTARGDYPQDVTLFDFPLWFKLKDASWAGDRFDLRELNRNTLMAERPTKAVTFVENHDSQFGRGLDSHVREWIKPLAYAYILLRASGYPCVFYGDYYGIEEQPERLGQPAGKNYLELLLKVRKQFALGEERYYDDRNVAGWVRMGDVPGARGALAVVINTAANGVRPINMDTGRVNRRFYHLATIKHAGTNDTDGFIVVRTPYQQYGDKSEAIWTGPDGRADFLADSGTVSLWLEDGVGLV